MKRKHMRCGYSLSMQRPSWERHSSPGVESGKGSLGQDGLLREQQQQKEDQGKCGTAAEWGRGTGDKGDRKAA